AKVDPVNVKASCLYFNKDSLGMEKLYINDLYSMHLPADMVVLSACETGVGELVEGEGIISLAQGFMYAGAGSVITSLWSVRDNSTSEFMKSFYQHLKTGVTKSEALRNTKIDFIENQPNYAHPFYWAPFVGIGDMQPVDTSEFPKWYTYLIGIALMLMVFYFFVIRK
ncbi:MAG: CHAT domain-containing protein, partial [Bacteroidota bacterium]